MKFSIITSTFNSIEFLKKNINSVESQTYKDFEHIFIDGFSNDGTLEMIKEYQKKYPNKIFLYQTKPSGISNAMNEGIKKSNGDYLIHLHSDDSLYNAKVLQKVNLFLNLHNYDWIYGKINTIDKLERSIGLFPTKKIFHYNGNKIFTKYLLKYYNYIPHQAVFIKKTTFERIGYFDESLTSAMDFDFWLKSRNQTNWTFIDEIISNYMIRPGAQSSDKTKRKENTVNTLSVQKRYLNKFELLISRIINIFIDIKNKSYK